MGLDGVIGDSTLTQAGIFETDANGEIRISNLTPGAYILTELRAPEGYTIDNPSTNVVIGEGGDTQTVVITNTPKGGLLIKKMDSVTKEPLSDVTFKVTTADGAVWGPPTGNTVPTATAISPSPAWRRGHISSRRYKPRAATCWMIPPRP